MDSKGPKVASWLSQAQQQILGASFPSALLIGLVNNPGPRQLHLFDGPVVAVRLDHAEAAHDGHAGLDAAKDGVLAVEPRGRG